VWSVVVVVVFACRLCVVCLALLACVPAAPRQQQIIACGAVLLAALAAQRTLLPATTPLSRFLKKTN
jgi:hypothetical protein